MTIDYDIALYRDKIRNTKQVIAEKSFELASSDDPFLIATLRRSLTTLNELLVLYEGTERILVRMSKQKPKKPLTSIESDR